MAKLLRLRRGTTTQHGSFTGAEGEVTVDTDKDTLVVHDNATAGGRPMLREDLNNMPASGVTAGTYGSSSAIPAITVDAKGRVTSATTSAIDSTAITNGTSNVSVAASGDITATRAGTTRLTVHAAGATVNGTLSSDGITIGDGDQIVVGDSNDFRIFHDGSRSIVQDQGTGSLEVLATNFVVKNAADNKNAIQAVDGGATILYHNGGEKISTTSTGINVTGSVTCDGLTSDGDATIRAGTGLLRLRDSNSTGVGVSNYVQGEDSGSNTRWQVGQTTTGNEQLRIVNVANADIAFYTNNTQRALITNGGHFQPAVTNAYDIGNSSVQWRNGYFDGTVSCDALDCQGTATVNGAFNCTGTVTVGQGQNASYITMADSDEGSRQIHCNSHYIGFLAQNGGWGARCDDNGHWLPGSNNAMDLGNSNFRWRNVYTNDLNLSNEGGANDVDGTWGSWTIQEGEDDLFLLNRRNGKKYKFNLSEVN